MDRIEEYVERCFKDIPDSDRKEQLRQEILQNLCEKINDLMEQGKTQEDAENKAIIEFGDIDDIKNELSKGIPAEKPAKLNKYSLRLGYSLGGSALIIALMVFINYSYGNQPDWWEYPTFAVLWWPLTMGFLWLRHK